ncbi:DUF2089 family protein [Barrientosiimonas marina]|uniref:DUF2089 family protein n=1 Tax=Lentibacillus kimchii TaxID=1542911 RepID=A0ABW2UVZ7_9BACI
MNIKDVPTWILSLEEEDVEFIKRFVLNSGSLKEISKIYGVTYPTVRTKLNRLIEKVSLNDTEDNQEFIKFIKQLSIDDRIELEEAKLIIDKYKKERDER